jgi:AraC-like DNA-binding protein
MSIPVQNPTSLSSIAALIARGLQTYGIDPVPILEQAKIDPARITDPNVRFPTKRIMQLWELSVAATGDPCIGLRVAEQFQPAVLHGLGLAWLSSDTLRDAFRRLVRYSRFIDALVDVSIEDTNTTTDLVIRGLEIGPQMVYEDGDAGMAILVRLSRLIAGSSINPVRVMMQRPGPACPEQFDTFFAAPIEYDAPEYRLCFDRELVDRPLETAHPELARMNDQTVVDYLARFDRASITMQVRSKIIEQLPEGVPKLEDLAGTLHVSLRSLQRRLNSEQTSFKNLLDNTRQTLAIQYIRESHRSLGEITYLLGFSEPSNFNRAFKRWTGKTPSEYRERS